MPCLDVQRRLRLPAPLPPPSHLRITFGVGRLPLFLSLPASCLIFFLLIKAGEQILLGTQRQHSAGFGRGGISARRHSGSPRLCVIFATGSGIRPLANFVYSEVTPSITHNPAAPSSGLPVLPQCCAVPVQKPPGPARGNALSPHSQIINRLFDRNPS